MGGIDVEAMEEAIRSWAVVASNLPDDRVRVRDHVGPRPPAKPYLVVKITDLGRQSWDAYMPPQAPGEHGIRRGDRILEAVIVAYGPGSMALLSRLQSDLHSSAASGDLSPLSYFWDQGIVDVSALRDTRIEEIARMDGIRFAVGITHTDRIQDGDTTSTIEAILLGYKVTTDTGDQIEQPQADGELVGSPHS